MNTKDYEKLTKANQYHLRRVFFESNTNQCCRVCDSMINGFCHTCNAWCTNVLPNNTKCFRIYHAWIDFLKTINRKDLNIMDFNIDNHIEDEEYCDEYEIIPFDKYFNNDYLVEALLNGKLEDVLDEYDRYCNNIIEKQEVLTDDDEEE